MWQCSVCGKRHTEPSGKKKSLTTTVAVRLNEDELKILDACPGGNRSKKLRFAIKNQRTLENPK